MKKFGTLFTAFFFVINLNAAIIKVVNPGNNEDIKTNLQAAVNKAVNGDVVQLPPGSFIVTGSITITKFVSIRGWGMNITTLYRSDSTSDASLNRIPILRFNINSLISSNIVVSGISFISKTPSTVPGDGKSLARDMAIDMINCVDFVITNCKFQYFGNGAVAVQHDDSLASGLIYKNQFIQNYKGRDAMGLGYGVVIRGSGKRWITNPQLGSKNFIFIEDNFFDYHRHSIAASGCAKYVARYNTCNHNIVAGPYQHCIDVHDARGLGNGSNTYGTRAIEVYNNQIINSTFVDGTPIKPGGLMSKIEEKAIAIKAGDAVIFENTIQGYRFGIGILSEHATGKYPYISQPGYQSGKKYGKSHTGTDIRRGDGDVYYWNNHFTAYFSFPKKTSTEFYNYNQSNPITGEPYFVKERDYNTPTVKPGYTPYTYPHPLQKLTVAG